MANSPYKRFWLISALMVLLIWITGCFMKVPPEKRPGTIEGVVTDSTTGLPIAGISALIVGTTYGAISGDDGSFRIRRLEPGKYTVRISAIGYKTIDKTVTVEPEKTTRVAISLAEHDRSIGVFHESLPLPPDLLPKYGHLKGRVVDSLTGEPIQKATVILKGTLHGASTDSLGAFTITDIEPGYYTLLAAAVYYQTVLQDSVAVLPGSTITKEIRLQLQEMGQSLTLPDKPIPW